jgi:alkyl hydroperoxide reductase subunit AhpC
VPNISHRKEKAEIEALQATVEKMKVDHEQAAKKWKLTENRSAREANCMRWCFMVCDIVCALCRLYGLIKDHTSHIEEAEKQVHKIICALICLQIYC